MVSKKMNKNIILSVLILYFTIMVNCQDRINWRVCSRSKDADACQQVARGNDKIACKENAHDIDCLQSIQYNRAQLGKISDEIALTGANLVNNDVVVLGEIVDPAHPPPETVIIVRKSIIVEQNLKDLKDKKYCHPGFKHDERFSQYLLKELDNSVITNEDLCAAVDKSALENQIKALSAFFGDSCRPGAWSQDPKDDAQLKSKYKKLCALCENNNCDVEYLVPFNDSLNCLINGGDLALTTAFEAKTFFESNPDNGRTYSYLCKDIATSSDECTWSKTLPQLLVVHKDAVNQVKDVLNKQLPNKMSPMSTQSVGNALISILDIKQTEKVSLLPSAISLKEYVDGKERNVPNVEKVCDEMIVKWCTHSEAENEKCKWFSQAALNKGILPSIQCIQDTGEEDFACLDKIAKHEVDIVTASADQAYVTLKKDLKAIAFPETDTRFLSTVLLVVKANNPDNIKSFEDLKNKSACFPNYGGKEYINFIKTAKSLNVVDGKSCKYDDILSNFLSGGCLPGIRSSLINDITAFADKDKLCSLCKPSGESQTATICNDDHSNLYYGTRGALKCVEAGDGNFAVITRTLANFKNGTDMQVICKNNTLAATTGLNVDDNCALNVITSSEVVIAKGTTKEANIVSLLHEVEMAFGQDSRKSFHLFDRFNDTINLLFKESTSGLTFPEEDNTSEYVQNYKTMLIAADNCNSGYKIVSTLISTVLMAVLTLLF